MTDLLYLITPTNLLEEKEKFFASRSYNPLFHYPWQDLAIEPTFSIKNKYPLWQAIRVQDHQAIMTAASNLFEVKLDDNILHQAQAQAKIKGLVSPGSAEEYAKLLTQAIADLSLGYRVELTDQAGFNSRPKHVEQKVLVSRHMHFDYFSMEGEVHHEMVHMMRYLNGRFNHLKRSQRFLPTEEGLASWCQDNTNADNGQAQHAMEYVASSVGVLGSLRNIFDCLRGLGMSAELAWKRASRHKFGFVETSQAGDILKPAMYYAHEIQIAKLSQSDKLKLFVGKISVGELKNYAKYTGLWTANQLISYFKLV